MLIYSFYFSNERMDDRLILNVANEVEMETELPEGIQNMRIVEETNGVGNLVGKLK